MNFKHLTAFLLGLGFATSTFAWDFPKCRSNFRCWDSNSIWWSAGSGHFAPGSAPQAAAEAARAAWNGAPATNFRFNFSYDPATTYSTCNGTHSLLMTNGYGWNGELGVTLRCYKACVWPFWGGKIDDADILFNPAWAWSYAQNPDPLDLEFDEIFGRFNFGLVAIHEMGHALGLNHEDDVMATMNTFYPNGGPISQNFFVQPHSDDVEGDRAGYGTPNSARDQAASGYRWAWATNGTVSGVSATPLVAPGVAYRNNVTPFPFTVENRGAVHEGGFTTRFYLSTDRTVTTADHFLGSSVLALSRGQIVTSTASVVVPNSVPVGCYFFGYITDPDGTAGETDEGNNAVTLSNSTCVSALSPPTACFAPPASAGPEPLGVSFDSSCSSDSDGTIVSYHWDFGDGNTSSQASPFWYFYYQSPNWGFFNVTLTVTDNDGLTASTSGWVSVDCTGGICV